MEAPPETASPDEWRDLARRYHRRIVELQREYDDHTQTSAMLERELEVTLEQKERQLRDAKQQINKIDRDNEFLKKKCERLQAENAQHEKETKQLKEEKDRFVSYVRELEQKNDDLERGQRAVSESVAGIEAMLYQAYERNAILEGEVDEIESLRIKLQRVSDEARDLKQELYVKEKLPNGNVSSSPILKSDSSVNKKLFIDSNKLTETETQTNLTGTPIKYGDMSLNGNTMTPSSRISALNIVGDLLRKVGVMESKLASCKAPIHARESTHLSSEYNKDPYRVRRLSSRGPSSPTVASNCIN